MERKESELNLLVGIDGVDAVLQHWFSATTAESFQFYSLCSYLCNLRSDYSWGFVFLVLNFSIVIRLGF